MPKFYEVVSAYQMPADSTIGDYYRRIIELMEQDSASLAEVNRLSNALRELQTWLSTASLKTCSPAKFAEETAREVLLSRALDDARRQSKELRELLDGAKNGLAREYQAYCEACIKLDKNFRYLRDAERHTLERTISSLSGLQRDDDWEIINLNPAAKGFLTNA